MNIKVTKKVHQSWIIAKDLMKNEDVPLKFKELIKCHMGKYQYLFKSRKGAISLISLVDLPMKEKTIWEIYEISHNKLFTDCERFSSKKEAEERIRELLK
jgi:hypothetical protein